MRSRGKRRVLVALASVLVAVLAAGPVSALTPETEVTVGSNDTIVSQNKHLPGRAGGAAASGLAPTGMPTIASSAITAG